jgi:hypothetical protein
MVDLKFLCFYFSVNQTGCVSPGCIKMQPVRWVGGQDVPEVNVRKLVWMTWIPTTMSLIWLIVARSSVPSVGHPTLKVGHSTSQKCWSFAGFIWTPWSPEKLSLKLASMVWSTIGHFDPEEPILYVPGDY